jgi:hypothetical protein
MDDGIFVLIVAGLMIGGILLAIKSIIHKYYIRKYYKSLIRLKNMGLTKDEKDILNIIETADDLANIRILTGANRPDLLVKLREAKEKQFLAHIIMFGGYLIYLHIYHKYDMPFPSLFLLEEDKKELAFQANAFDVIMAMIGMAGEKIRNKMKQNEWEVFIDLAGYHMSLRSGKAYGAFNSWLNEINWLEEN